jgi:AcrR family transcriptional regulator
MPVSSPAVPDEKPEALRPGRRAQRESATPLASVLAALRKAEDRGELSATELEWSVARLSGKVRRGNPRLEGVDRRDSILRASAEVFRRHGYNRATIEDVAAELFLTKAGVYHYFSSKQEILEGLCDRAMAAAEEAVERAEQAESQPLPRVRRMLEEYTTAVMQEPAFTVLMRHLDEVGEASLADLQRRRKSIEARLRTALEEGIEAGVFEMADTRISVFGMLGAINWIYTWFEPDGRLPAEEVRDNLVALVLNGILARHRRRAG